MTNLPKKVTETFSRLTKWFNSLKRLSVSDWGRYNSIILSGCAAIQYLPHHLPNE